MARCQSLFHPTAQACAVGYKIVGSRIAVQRRGGELVNVPGRSDGWSMRCGGGLGCRAGRHRIVRARWAAPWVLASESPLGRPNDDFRTTRRATAALYDDRRRGAIRRQGTFWCKEASDWRRMFRPCHRFSRSSALDPRRVRLRVRRQRSERSGTRHVLPALADSTPVCAFPVFQPDEQYGYVLRMDRATVERFHRSHRRPFP